MPNIAIPRLEDYDISPRTGFLPEESPLQRLPDPYFEPWEAAIQDLESLLLTERLRERIDEVLVIRVSFEHPQRNAHVYFFFSLPLSFQSSTSIVSLSKLSASALFSSLQCSHTLMSGARSIGLFPTSCLGAFLCHGHVWQLSWACTQ